MCKSVLIIDESEKINELFKTVFKAENYQLFSAHNGQQAIDAANNHNLDLIFLDDKILDINGHDVLTELKSGAGTRDIPIILLTEKAPELVMQNYNTNGTLTILKKPVNQEDFLISVQTFQKNEDKLLEAGKDIDILVAEDDAVTRRMVEYLLKKNGYNNLRLVVDGEQALLQFSEKRPELMILDYFMPHQNGFQVLEKIRKNPGYNHIPIIFLTAVDDKSKLIEALKSGATDYITKPFDKAELLARVHAHARNFYLQKKIRETNTKLESLNKELRKKNDQIQGDLQSARKIQEALLPKDLSTCEHLDVHFFYQASNTVGGDFFNFFKIDENRVGVYIADVSGHGVTSALVTVFIREQINNILRKFNTDLVTPAGILRQLNINFNKEEFFIENGIYLTIFCGVLDLKKYRLSYSSAGHHALPLLLDADGKIIELAELGVAIGFLEDFEYENFEIDLEPGQNLFLHTDGIIEMSNGNNELFGMDRLKTFLIENNRVVGEELLVQLVKESLSFSKNSEPQDDIALILLEIK